MTSRGDLLTRQAISILPETARTPELQSRLGVYLEALLEANRGINLVSRQDTVAHVARFARECLFLANLLAQNTLRRTEPPRLLDLGSGGGFPGMVVKLALPDVQATLVEATQKKARFLAEVCRKLELRGITVIWARAEALSDRRSSYFRPEFRHAFDWVTAKALGSLRESLDLAAPFLRENGTHWTFKGPRYEAEVAACRQRFGQLRFELFRADPIPGDRNAFVVSVRRLVEPRPRASRETTCP